MLCITFEHSRTAASITRYSESDQTSNGATMQNYFRNFWQETSGAVTVDWVVLTAALVGLGIATAMSVADGTSELGEDLGTFLETDTRFIQNQ